MKVCAPLYAYGFLREKNEMRVFWAGGQNPAAGNCMESELSIRVVFVWDSTESFMDSGTEFSQALREKCP